MRPSPRNAGIETDGWHPLALLHRIGALPLALTLSWRRHRLHSRRGRSHRSGRGRRSCVCAWRTFTRGSRRRTIREHLSLLSHFTIDRPATTYGLMGDFIRLRDLPAIAQVESMCRARKPFDPPFADATFARLDEVSVSLFGITRFDTLCEEGDGWEWEGDDALTQEEYLARFKATEVPWSEAASYWELLGWDLTDKFGNPLQCAWCFERQIISAKFGLNEGAKFTSDGSGTWGVGSSDDHESRLEAWREQLERDAIAFIQRR